jgi:hypothetical protein
MQYKLLPELLQVSFYVFTDKFMYIRDELFNLIKSCIIYLGAIAEFEVLEIAEKNKKELENSLAILSNVDNELENYRQELISKNNVFSLKVFLISIILIVVFSVFIFILI